MPTEVVSGRVDSRVKKIADMYIQREGYSTAEVINGVWERIATTGEIPVSRESQHNTDKVEALQKLKDLRSKTPLGTPLATMTDEDFREALASRD